MPPNAVNLTPLVFCPLSQTQRAITEQSMTSIVLWARGGLEFCAKLRDGVIAKDDGVFDALVRMKVTGKALLGTARGGTEACLVLEQLLKEINHVQLATVRGSQEARTLGGMHTREGDVVVVVLGCKDRASQKLRVAAAHELVASLCKGLDHQGERLDVHQITVVFSGGGQWLEETEAQEMQRQWNTELGGTELPGVALLLEEDSLDTVGNAVFSMAKLQQKRDVGASLVYCVTHQFHASRTMLIFSNVFGRRNLCVVGVLQSEEPKLGQSNMKISFDTMTSKDAALLRAVHELKSEHTTSQTLFLLPLGGDNAGFQVEEGDWKSIMMVMFSFHGLYKERYDLRRRYL